MLARSQVHEFPRPPTRPMSKQEELELDAEGQVSKAAEPVRRTNIALKLKQVPVVDPPSITTRKFDRAITDTLSNHVLQPDIYIQSRPRAGA